MTVEILKHNFVPSHEILSAKDAKEVLEFLGTTKDKLPKMFLNDPVAKRIKSKEGDVIRIVRKSQTAGETVYYRVVV